MDITSVKKFRNILLKSDSPQNLVQETQEPEESIFRKSSENEKLINIRPFRGIGKNAKTRKFKMKVAKLFAEDSIENLAQQIIDD